jgi:hypothetical protein
MTLTELKNTHFAHFDQWPVEKIEQLKAIEYIEQMASISNTDISAWDILTIFADEANPGRIITAKRDINKKLYAKGEEKPPIELTDDQRGMIAYLDSNFKRSRANALVRFEKEYKSKLRAATEMYEGFESHLTAAWDTKKTIDMINNVALPKGEDVVKSILQNRFWELHDVYEATVLFRTASDIILTERNDAAGTDMRVNMGKYIASADFAAMKITVSTYTDALYSRNGYFHPYINSNGKICWGNGSGSAEKMLSMGDMKGALDLLQGVLTQYSSDTTPFESLYAFQQAELQAKRQIIPRAGSERSEEDECEDCGMHPEDCECFFCDRCEERTGRERCDEH